MQGYCTLSTHKHWDLIGIIWPWHLIQKIGSRSLHNLYCMGKFLAQFVKLHIFKTLAWWPIRPYLYVILTIIIYNYYTDTCNGFKSFRQHAFMALPAHSALCQTYRSSAVLKAPCSTHTGNCFHFLQMKEEKIEWRFIRHKLIIYEKFDLPVKFIYLTELTVLTTSNIIPICS